MTKVIESNAHDACITWRAGNGTILLQNVVRKDEECVKSRLTFWSQFIDLYYRGSGSTVTCCQGDGCNNGIHNFRNREDANMNQERLQSVLPGVSDLSGMHNLGTINIKLQKLVIFITLTFNNSIFCLLINIYLLCIS